MRRFLLALIGLLILTAQAGCSASIATPTGQADPPSALNRLPEAATGPCTSNLSGKVRVTSAQQVAEAERIAMPSDQFWQLIATLRGSNSDAAYHRLSTSLARLPLKSILGFDARLTLALYALDDECRANWYSQHDPSGLGFLADDDFLYVRADTVTAGEAEWKRAVSTDTLPWGSTDAVNGDGESLLYVGLEAAGQHGVDDSTWMDRESSAFALSYETGSNPLGWPDSND